MKKPISGAKNKETNGNTAPETDLNGHVNGSTKKDNPFVKGAMRATQETKQDVKECQDILSAYAADTTEMLHLIEDWLSSILKDEFMKQTERMKLRLLEKYRKGQLKSDKPDVGEKKKKLLQDILAVEKWRRDGIEEMSETLTQHIDTSKDYLVVDNDALKKSLDEFLVEVNRLNKRITEIALYRDLSLQPNTAVIDALLQECEENKRLIAKMQEMNQKEKFTIVILGLEKA